MTNNEENSKSRSVLLKHAAQHRDS